MRWSARIIPFLLLSALSTAWAAPANRIATTIDNKEMVVLKGSVSPQAQPKNDLGPFDPSTKLPHITLLFAPSAAQQAALKQLLAEQQDPASPNYHNWLTPEQFGERFGLSHADITKIIRWLRSQGFGIVEVARGRDWIAFSGTVAQVQLTFHTQLHRYNVDGEERFANAEEPSVPKALEGIVAGFRGLGNFRLQPSGVEKSDSINLGVDYFNGGNNLAPGDIATIYDLGPLYAAGIDGTGVKLAIVGQTDIYTVDIDQFRAGFGLSVNDPQQILATGCTDPGVTGDLVEADLDLEWSGAVARNATIIFVKCDTTTHSGVINSAQYAIDNDVAPVISMSYGLCEALQGQPNMLAFQREIQKANSEGITFLASSGDSGAAACDLSHSSQATQGLAVNGPASIPEVTAVGGTEFNEGGGTYWGNSNGANGGSALSYIPELAWDDSSAGTGFQTGALASTGGGASIYFQKPSWQTGPGVPTNNFRYVPDVSMPASAVHDGYIVCTRNGGCAGGVQNGSIFGGTSVAAPVFAGIVTLLNQYLVKNGTLTTPGLQNINTTLYPYAQSNLSAFHDVPAGNYSPSGNPSGNVVPCQTGTPNCTTGKMGFITTTGYDQATGLGSVDANVFVTGWNNALTKISTSITLTSPTTPPVLFSSRVTFTATVSPAPAVTNPPQTVQFYVLNPPRGHRPLGTAPLSNAGVATLTITNLPGGNNSVFATYGGDTGFGASTSAPLPFAVEDFTIAASPTTITISAPGGSGKSTITITPQGGFNQAVTFSCLSGLPSETTWTFSPASVTPNGTAAVTTTLTVQTMAPSALLQHPFGRSSVFFATLVPGLLGLVMLKGNRKRTWRGLRLMSLLAILTLSTLWMPACGGGSSSGTPSNPGTPVGTTPNVMVSATTGGTTPLANPVAITVVVQ
jgi:hypothetical protein